MPTVYSAKNHQKEKIENSDKNIEKNLPVSRKLLHNIRKDLEKIKGSNFKSFHSFPQNIKFETQETKEQIILFLRKHFITNIGWILISLLMFFLPFFLNTSSILSFMPLRFQTFTIILWYIMFVIFVLENFLSWYFNVYIITDERVIDVDFYSLVYKHISETKIDKIEDVTYTQGGFFQSFFNYGRVDIQTAGEVTEFEFEAVPRPCQVAKVLNQLILQEEQEKIEGRIS